MSMLHKFFLYYGSEVALDIQDKSFNENKIALGMILSFAMQLYLQRLIKLYHIFIRDSI